MNKPDLALSTFAEAVDAARQSAEWGSQHYPDVDPRDFPYVTHAYCAARAEGWRGTNAERATPTITGRCRTHSEDPHTHMAWGGIFLEKVYEALAKSDPAEMEAWLLQVAAVAQAWINDLHSRRVASPEGDLGTHA